MPVRSKRPARARTFPLRAGALAALALAALLAIAQPAWAQDCMQPAKNMQCTDFGAIVMDTQRDIRGTPIDVAVTTTLNTAYADQGARWLLFSVRNVEPDGSNPVTISLTRFSTEFGDVVTTRVEHPSPSELNLWVDVLDTPVGTPITIEMQVGATQRGAFRLETLVMPFDRGYAPLKDPAGADMSLFSFTLLGVNEETPGAAADGESVVQGRKMPGWEIVPVTVALGLVAFAARAAKGRDPA